MAKPNLRVPVGGVYGAYKLNQEMPGGMFITTLNFATGGFLGGTAGAAWPVAVTLRKD